MHRRRLAALALGLWLTDPTLAAAAEPVELASHEAVYRVRNIRVKPGGDYAGADGTLRFRLARVCDGWTTELTSRMVLYPMEGEPRDHTWTLIAWEAADGGSYRFRVRSTIDATTIRAYQGTARVNGDDGGSAAYMPAEGEPMTVDLPPGTLFPTAHTRAMLSAFAGDGPGALSVPLFDGSDVDGAQFATAIRTKALAAGVPAEVDHDLTAGPSWRVQMAFFKMASTDERNLPDFEMAVRYHANGVADDITQDDGALVSHLRLVDLTALPEPDC